MKGLLLIVFLLGGPSLQAQEAAKEDGALQVLRIGENERVVHVLGSPFTHSYYEFSLETLLLKAHGHRGLVYRRVDLDRTTADLARDVERLVLIHGPTLVILQTGSEDLRVQYRRATFDFSGYPGALESLVRKLREKKIRLVVCSTVPVGSLGAPNNLVPPLDGLKAWVDAAREIARRHDALFVDLFTGALGWKMVGPGEYLYDSAGHEQSWRLFLSQLRFEPAGFAVRIDVPNGKVEGKGVTVSSLKIGPAEVSFSLEGQAGAGPVTLRIEGLREGDWTLDAGGREAVTKSSRKLGTGIDVGGWLESRAGSKEFKEELVRGHKAAVSLESIGSYKLPDWISLPDFNRQRQAAWQAALDTLNRHDVLLREWTRSKAVTVRVRSR